MIEFARGYKGTSTEAIAKRGCLAAVSLPALPGKQAIFLSVPAFAAKRTTPRVFRKARQEGL